MVLRPRSGMICSVLYSTYHFTSKKSDDEKNSSKPNLRIIPQRPSHHVRSLGGILITRLWKPKLPSANSTTITRSSKRTRRATQLLSRKHAPFFQVSAHRIQSHQGPTSFVNFASMTLHGYSAARASMPSLLISRRKVERRRVYDL